MNHEPLPLKLIYNFSQFTNLSGDNLKIVKTVTFIEPWVEWMSVLYLPLILLMKSKFHSGALRPYKIRKFHSIKSQSIK